MVGGKKAGRRKKLRLMCDNGRLQSKIFCFFYLKIGDNKDHPRISILTVCRFSEGHVPFACRPPVRRQGPQAPRGGWSRPPGSRTVHTTDIAESGRSSCRYELKDMEQSYNQTLSRRLAKNKDPLSLYHSLFHIIPSFHLSPSARACVWVCVGPLHIFSARDI